MCWNYFLQQIQHSQRLKNRIQLYTQAPDRSPVALNDKTLAALEFIKPILAIFDGACKMFQQDAPTKNLVLPIYNSLIKKMHHYACDSPQLWSQACHAAKAKLHKYKDLEIRNNDTLIATLLNHGYRQGMLQLVGVSPP
ncbi:hypothetical protein O181_114773 [Austropuccinia psidii MF-1]|uniref:Uncharacterized protein n=1 Tax=Austropuccinia psidii MF-1 TaxID=1389203 RepID=A0A9Q3PUV9_9BASI|nr:hypothetical protein [Austropuccinia psidii MF-1]